MYDHRAMHRAFIIVVLVTTCTPSSPASEMKFHRLNAGAPDADGWYDARSTNGGFRVRMPIPFNDGEAKLMTKGGRPGVMHTIGQRTADGVKFAVSCMDGNPEKQLRELVEESRQDPTIVDVRDAPLGDSPGVIIRRRTKTREEVARVIELRTDRSCVLTVEALAPTAFPEEVAKTFFESFSLN